MATARPISFTRAGSVSAIADHEPQSFARSAQARLNRQNHWINVRSIIRSRRRRIANKPAENAFSIELQNDLLVLDRNLLDH